MATFDNSVSLEQKEAAAVTVMRCMLISFAENKKLPFESVMLSFSRSRTYEALFDFETEIWKEGPEYLRGLYEAELEKAPCDSSGIQV